VQDVVDQVDGDVVAQQAAGEAGEVVVASALRDAVADQCRPHVRVRGGHVAVDGVVAGDVDQPLGHGGRLAGLVERVGAGVHGARGHERVAAVTADVEAGPITLAVVLTGLPGQAK
jgi:hypothetical protein